MTQKEKFIKIREHLAYLHDKWEKDPYKDGHHKSSEGSIEITLYYPDWFDCDTNAKKYMEAKPTHMISVYSYLFGEGRLHEFASIDEAYDNVMSWEYKTKVEELKCEACGDYRFLRRFDEEYPCPDCCDTEPGDFTGPGDYFGDER